MPRTKPCLICGTPSHGPRCPQHTTPRAYNTAEYQAARRVMLAGATRCWICGLPATPSNPLEADHTHPISEGGTPAGPLRAAHHTCNARRGALRQAGRMTA
jgi:5-methylcytosine-specific restriction endonuclease McrA